MILQSYTKIINVGWNKKMLDSKKKMLNVHLHSQFVCHIRYSLTCFMYYIKWLSILCALVFD